MGRERPRTKSRAKSSAKSRAKQVQAAHGGALLRACAAHSEAPAVARCPRCELELCEECALAPEESLCLACAEGDFADIVARRLGALRAAGWGMVLALPFVMGLVFELFATYVSGRPTGGLAFLVGLAVGLVLDLGAAASWRSARGRFLDWFEERRGALAALHEEAGPSKDRELEAERAALLLDAERASPRVLSFRDLAWMRGPYPAAVVSLVFGLVVLAFRFVSGDAGLLTPALLLMSVGLVVIAGVVGAQAMRRRSREERSFVSRPRARRR